MRSLDNIEIIDLKIQSKLFYNIELSNINVYSILNEKWIKKVYLHKEEEKYNNNIYCNI